MTPPSRPYYKRHSTLSEWLKSCCFCMFLLLSFLVLLVLAVGLIVVLGVKPKKPQFDLQKVAVVYMGFSNHSAVLDPTTVSLSLTIRMLFTARNPNKVGIKYGQSNFTVMYKGMPLGRGIVPGFYQTSNSTRNVDGTIYVDRVNLMQANAADLVRDASLYDRVEFTVRGDVSAKLRAMGIDSPGAQVSLNCWIGISPRQQSIIYKQCGIDGLSV